MIYNLILLENATKLKLYWQEPRAQPLWGQTSYLNPWLTPKIPTMLVCAPSPRVWRV